MKLRQSLIQQLAKFGVEDRLLAGRDDGFSTLFYHGKAFAHFHSDSELDLRLTRDVIKLQGLLHPPDSIVHPGRKKTSQWIEVRFNTRHNLERVIDLVKLAIVNL